MPSMTRALAVLRRAADAMMLFWASQRKWLKRWYVKLLLGLALVLGITTAAANIWGVRHLNSNLLPSAQPQMAAMMAREVDVGRVKWVAPSGVLGLHPLAAIGPVRVGPGPIEHSSALLPNVRISMDPVQSLVQRQVVLKIHIPAAQLDNFAWFGYPDDTIPSARDVLPGKMKGGSPARTKQQGDVKARRAEAAAVKQAQKEARRRMLLGPPDASANFVPVRPPATRCSA
eukprot:jgi/Astpho2/5156/Aster-x0241